MRLYDLAHVIRSKNAGPYTLTVDLVFADRASYDRLLSSPDFSEVTVARLYGVSVQAVAIRPFDSVLTVKVSLPRPGPSSGAPGDTDVYGCQQHFPLADLEL